MFTSALSLVTSEHLVKGKAENITLPCKDLQSVITIDVAVFRLSPLAEEDEDIMLRFARFGYHLYLSGLFVHVASSWSLIVWVPISVEQDLVKQLSRHFEVVPISVHQSMHWLKGALARSLTLHNDRVIALDFGVLLDDRVVKLDLRVSEKLTNDEEARIVISSQPNQENWRACCLVDLDLELCDTVYLAPSLLHVSPSYIEEESTQDEDSEQWYLEACLRWGYKLTDRLLKLAFMSSNGEIVISRVFPQMIVKKEQNLSPEQMLQRHKADSEAVAQLLKACIKRWSCFLLTGLDTIDVSKCLLSNRPTKIPFKLVRVGPRELSKLQEQSSKASSIPCYKRPGSTFPKTSFSASKESLSERYERVIKVITEKPNLNTKMRGLLDEIRRDLECVDTSIPEPVKMKSVKTSKRQTSSKLVAKLSPPDLPRKVPQRTPQKSKKMKGSTASPIVANLPKKSDRRVHFNTTVLFVDEWDKVHRIKLQQQEAVSYHQEDDLQQDIESEFTASFLS
ncbi:Hypothetical protein GLP15_4399 [Giardia lamblia P15]|uniref:Uncharacterized protein n=1 Tax=Giardia intestinalis (strain P15) TaxID=658858 RepID=E1F356_GIAIA|nr:Hypothetical protein GLP15_4399 [Giardia lamblia P15]